MKIAGLSDFKWDQIIDANMIITSVTKTAELFCAAKSSVPRGRTAFEKERKHFFTEAKL